MTDIEKEFPTLRFIALLTRAMIDEGLPTKRNGRLQVYLADCFFCGENLDESIAMLVRSFINMYNYLYDEFGENADDLFSDYVTNLRIHGMGNGDLMVSEWGILGP